MRRSVLVLALLIAVSASAATHQVAILNPMSFSPAQLTIAQGDTVTWTMAAAGFHSTTSNTNIWDSGFMSSQDATFSFTFQNTGTFPYYCKVHSTANGTSMNGVITVTGAKVATSTTLESSVNPTVYGQNGTLTATVTKTGASAFDPTGTVTFTADSVALCSAVSLSGGTATCSTAPLIVGPHPVTATYNGDANFDPSTSSPPLVQQVDKASTTNALMSSANPSTVGQTVMFTATLSVTSPGGGTPTGTVTFKDGSTDLCLSAGVVNGSAACGTSGLSAGTHSITAIYSGENRFNGSTSPAVSQVVTGIAIPANFSAFAPDPTQVMLSWSAASGATSYEVWRSVSINAPFALHLVTGDTSALDTSVSAGVTYLYKVRTVSGGDVSAFSAIDAATTIAYTSGSVVQAIHVTELRNGVNAMRAAAGLAPFSFADDPLSAGTVIRAVHVSQLRTALSAARAQIPLSAIAYTDPTLLAGGSVIRAAHVNELRAGTQ